MEGARRAAVAAVLLVGVLALAALVASIEAPIPGGSSSDGPPRGPGSQPGGTGGAGEGSGGGGGGGGEPGEPGGSEPGEPGGSDPGEPGGGEPGGTGDGEGATGSDGPRDPTPGERPRRDPPELQGLLWLLVAVAAVGALLGVVAWLSRRSRKDGPAGSPDDATGAEAAAPPGAAALLQQLPPGADRTVVQSYVDACTFLARAGVSRGLSETTGELARRAPPRVRPAMLRLTGLYEAVRHGGRDLGPGAGAEAEALAREVAAAADSAAAEHGGRAVG